MSAPVARTVPGASAFTVACVPTGMKAGVATGPCGVMISPQRAAPSVAINRKERPVIGSHATGSRIVLYCPAGGPVPHASTAGAPTRRQEEEDCHELDRRSAAQALLPRRRP